MATIVRAFLALLVVAVLSVPASASESSAIVRHAVKAKFSDVIDDMKNAIANRGLVIDHTSHVGKMLDRTGKDLGTTKRLYGDDQGWVFSFCSSTVSRGTMEADIHNIAFCPYTIAVYSTVAEPDTVYVSYRRPMRPDGSAASHASLKAVEKLLDGIVREALNLN